MEGTFLGHLEDLVEQTSGISERVNKLVEVLEHQTPLIEGQADEFGICNFTDDSTNFITLKTLSFLRKYWKIEFAISPNGREYFWNISRDALLDRSQILRPWYLQEI
jgi:hypothetical protein